MGAALYQWVADWLSGKQPVKSGAILLLDDSYRERSRLEFDHGLITEVAFPALNAGSMDKVCFSLSLQPEVTRFRPAFTLAVKVGFERKLLPLLAARYQLQIGSIATANVERIEAIAIKQTFARREASGLQVPNLIFSLPESDAKDWFEWFEDFVVRGNNGPGKSRAGTLEFMSANGKQVLFRLGLSGLGIFRLRRERAEPGSTAMAKARVELYCERLTFVPSPVAIGVSVPETDFWEETLRKKSLGATGPGCQVDGARVAHRLLAGRPFTPDAEAATTRKDRGLAIGTRWASEAASLSELKELSELEPVSWSAVRLPEGHSLVHLLRHEGILPPGEKGDLELQRENFVEGIVAGAAQVLREAAPYIVK